MKEHDDVVLEPEQGGAESEGDELEAAEEQAEGKIAKMKKELDACRKEKQEYMDGWQRAKADYVNLLKRGDENAKAAERKGKVGAVEALLPAFDALERAKEHGEIPEGFAAIARQLESAFAGLGLEELGKEGETFDPALHDALGQDAVESPGKDNLITAVLEKGWKVADTVIRPAKVRVGHFAS